MTRRCASVLTAVLLGASTPSVAQPGAPTPPAPDPREGARALYAQGTAHFNVGEYDEAIAAFKASYKLAPVPLLLYNIAQAYRQKNACAQASRFYRTYLREDPTTKLRAKVEEQLEKMDACAATQPPPAPDPTAVPDPTVPDPTIAPDPTVAPDPTIAPDPTVAPDPTATPDPTSTPMLDPGSAAAVPGLVRAPSEPIDVDRGRRWRIGGAVSAGVGVAAVGIGVAFSFHVRALADEISVDCDDGCTAEAVIDHDRRGGRAERTAAIAYGVGGLAIAAGVGAYLIGRDRGPGGSTVALVPTRAGGVVMAAWGF